MGRQPASQVALLEARLMAAPLSWRSGFLGLPGWEPSAKERQVEDSGSRDRTLTPGKGGAADRPGGDRVKPGPLLFLARLLLTPPPQLGKAATPAERARYPYQPKPAGQKAASWRGGF